MGRLGKKAEVEIIKLYLTNLSCNFHLRQIARKLDMDHTSVRPYMDSLKTKGIIKEESRGRNKIFFLNTVSDLLPYYLQEAEADRTAEFLAGSKVIRSFWDGFRNRISLEEQMEIETLVLFGSFAKGTFDKASDIDLFISMPNGRSWEETHQKIEKLETVIGHSINLEKVSSLKGFINKGPADTFQEIINHHIVLLGIERFIQTVRRFVYG